MFSANYWYLITDTTTGLRAIAQQVPASARLVYYLYFVHNGTLWNIATTLNNLSTPVEASPAQLIGCGLWIACPRRLTSTVEVDVIDLAHRMQFTISTVPAGLGPDSPSRAMTAQLGNTPAEYRD